jgi:hypothetical protein
MTYLWRFRYMERSSTVLLLAVVAAAAWPPTGETWTAASPALRLLSRHPVTIRGRSFHPGERVRLRLNVPSTGTRRLKTGSAGATGTFTVAFRGLAVGKCTAFSVTAIGATGSRASLKILPLPGCIPA